MGKGKGRGKVGEWEAKRMVKRAGNEKKRRRKKGERSKRERKGIVKGVGKEEKRRVK